MKRQASINDVATILLALLVLFFPVKQFYIFHAGVAAVLVFFIFAKGSVHLRWHVLVVLVLLIYVSIICVLTGIRFNVDIVRNTIEAFRFFPLLLLWMCFKPGDLRFSTLFNILALYCLINLFVTVLQFGGVGIATPITAIYGNSYHAVNAGFRPVGLSPGPGQNAAMMVLCFGVFVAAISLRYRTSISSAALLCTVATVLLAQSRSGFVAVVGAFVYFLILSSAKLIWTRRKPRVALIAIVGGALGSFVYYFWHELNYLSVILIRGLNVHSYSVRLDRWAGILDITFKDPVFLILGHGKDVFGPVSGAMDNEYLYFVAVYGLLVSFLVWGVLAVLVVRPLLSRANLSDPRCLVMGLAVFGGVVMAWSTAYLLDPRVTLLLGMLYVALPTRLRDFNNSSSVFLLMPTAKLHEVVVARMFTST